MTRFHQTVRGPVPFTPEEEAARDTEEASFATAETLRVIREDAASRLLTLAVESTGTPALNGTYDIGLEARANITGIATALALGFGFPPNDAPTLGYGDVDSTPHEFDADHFKAFARAVMNYVYNVNAALQLKLAGTPADWPATPVVIA